MIAKTEQLTTDELLIERIKKGDLVAYNDIVSLTKDTNGEFPLDFTLGYKINL